MTRPYTRKNPHNVRPARVEPLVLTTRDRFELSSRFRAQVQEGLRTETPQWLRELCGNKRLSLDEALDYLMNRTERM